ncbi:MAG: ATP-binding protein [Tissierellia bacterium]|nr:ATP-binding protein [Tissierellia bacterium]
MKVAGITNTREVYIGSRERNFRISEYLIVKDPQGDLVGEIIGAETYNRYIPLGVSSDFVDSGVLESLSSLGYSVDDETIYIGKLRLINEALYPVETGSLVVQPEFQEIKNLLIKTSIDQGMVLGAIKNTDNLYDTMDDDLKGVYQTFEDGEVFPQMEVPYLFDYRSMHQYPHIGIFGGSGSGKSFGLRVLLEEIMKKYIPTVVLDPHYEMSFSTNTSYSRDISYNDKFSIYKIGKDVGVNFEDLNRGDLKNLLSATFQITEPMSAVVDSLFKNRTNLGHFKNTLIGLSEAQDLGSDQNIQKRINEAESPSEKEAWEFRLNLFQKHSKTCNQASVNGVLWRLQSLENQGIFSKDIKPIESGLKYGKMVVIQGSTKMIQVFATYLLNNIYKKRREYKDAQYMNEEGEYFPPFFIVTDEAHNFAPKGMESPSKGIIKEISQEGRKYGVFLIFATQRPTLLDETVSAQLNTKFIFRTVRATDIQTIREETDLSTDETSRLPYLKTGDVFVSSSSIGRTSFVRIRAADTETPFSENPFDELKKNLVSENDELYGLIKPHLPINETNLLEVLKRLESDGKKIEMKELELGLAQLVNSKHIELEDNLFLKRWIDAK